MKRVLLMLDAAADFPFPELDDQTPLAYAKLPHASQVAEEGRLGTLKLSRAEADASRSLLAEACGMEFRAARELRWGPVAAAALGVPKDSTRMRFLCQFVHVDAADEQMALCPSSVEEQDHLIRDVEKALRKLGDLDLHLLSLNPGRFVLDMPRGSMAPSKIKVRYDREGSLSRLPAPLRTLIQAAETCLEEHPVNAVRQDLGEPSLNGIWCWSGGASTPSKPGALTRSLLISPDPLIKGLATLWGLDFIEIPDPYTLSQPDAGFDVSRILEAFETHDELILWIPAPFATNKYEGPKEKVRRLAAVDYYITGPLLAILQEFPSSRMLLLAAGLRHRGRPEKGRVPFVLWGDGIVADHAPAWNEIQAGEGSLGSPKLGKLLEIFRSKL
jgi:2,3-bisphosphoglycerate-independent phosphoglycerate mutase